MLKSPYTTLLFLARFIINIVFVAVLSYQTTYALLTWQQPVARVQTPSITQPSVTRPFTPKPSEHLNADLVTDAHLFGQKERRTNTQINTPKNLPKTKLNLILNGIFYHDDPSKSHAMIQVASTPPKKTYREGDTIQSGVKLYAIKPHEVTLLRNGKYETLTFRKDKQFVTHAYNDTQTFKKNRLISDKTPEQQLKRYQQQLRTNPQRLMRLLRISPVKENGRFIGYRLRSGKDKTVLQTFNLRSGDILTAVNGIQLDSPLKGLSLIQKLATAKQLNLELRRNGQNLDLSFSLD